MGEDKAKKKWEEVSFLLLYPFKGVLIESIEKNRDQLGEWISSHYWFFVLASCIWKKLPASYLNNSLVYRRLLEWQRSVLWSALAAYSGMYESLVRELRFLVEDLVQSIYIDQQLGDVELEAKVNALSLLEDTRLRGTRLITKADIPQGLKTNLTQLYRRLSGYVHPSENLVRSALHERKFIFSLIETGFQDSLTLHRETYDMLLALILSCFPEAINCFMNHRDSVGSIIKDELEFRSYSHTLAICRSLRVDVNESSQLESY